MKNNKKMQKGFQKGFTIIELLTTIAILGILAAVVAGSVNYARERGADTAITQAMGAARTQSELYYGDNGESYAGICDVTPASNGTLTINQNLENAQAAWGTTTQALNIDLNTAGSYNKVTCHENGPAFAAEVPLKGTASGAPVMYCLDSAGTYKQETVNLAAGSVVCD